MSWLRRERLPNSRIADSNRAAISGPSYHESTGPEKNKRLHSTGSFAESVKAYVINGLMRSLLRVEPSRDREGVGAFVALVARSG